MNTLGNFFDEYIDMKRFPKEILDGEIELLFRSVNLYVII